MVIMLDHVSLPVQALSNTTLIMLCSMVRNLSFHVSRFSYKNKVMVIKVGRTLTRYDMSFVCLVLMLLSMNCMISYGIIAKGIVWVIFRFVTFGERAERVVWKICGTSRIHCGFRVL